MRILSKVDFVQVLSWCDDTLVLVVGNEGKGCYESCIHLSHHAGLELIDAITGAMARNDENNGPGDDEDAEMRDYLQEEVDEAVEKEDSDDR